MAESFQPGGRAPAPAPLDLVQDFVNTEVPDWNRDDVGTPEALAAWLCDRGLIRPDDVVGADTFVAARALRAALRELALANTLGEPPPEERRAVLDAALAAFPLVVRIDADGPGVAPAGSGAARRPRGDRRGRRRGASGRHLGAAQGLPAGDLWLALLRRLAQPLLELVLDAGVRRPREVPRVPPPQGREHGLVVAPGRPATLRAAANASHAVVLGRPHTFGYAASLRPCPARFSPPNHDWTSRSDH